MPAYLTPGVYFESADRADRRRGGIAALRTDVAGFVGVAERGPLDQPVRVESFEQFRSVFGEFLPAGFLAYALKAFFENGGRRAWCVRVAGASAEAANDPAAPWPADGSYAVVDSIAGFVAGGVVTVSQGDALRLNRRLAAVDALRRRLVFERPLPPSLDPLAATSFAIGPAAAWSELRGSDGVPTLRLAAASPGAWGNGLEVRFGRASTAATLNRPVPQPQDRRSSLVADVVGFGPGTLVRLFQGGAALREAYRVVREADPVRRLLAWTEPLPATFDLAVGDGAAPPISLESVELGLTVVRDGRVEEVFAGLSLVPAHPRWVERAVAGSAWIRAVDLQAGSPAPSPFPDRLPDSLSGPGAGTRRPGTVALSGGRDGLATLTAAHLTGDPGSEVRRGLRALEAIDEVALVAIPDALIRPAPPVARAPRPLPEPDPCLPGAAPEPPPGPPLAEREDERAPDFGLEGLFAVQEAMVAHCETLRDRFALLDPPLLAGPDLALSEIQAWRERFDTRYAALYHPWVQVYDPRRPRAALVKPVPPSGHVAGVYARTDLAVGVHKAPANEELRWAQGLTQELDDAEQGLLNPLGINCLRAFPGRGLRVYGARTLSSDTPWRYVPVRRLVTMIAEALEEALAWAVFEPHDDALRQTLTVAIGSFLEGLWARGALAGTTPAEAFVVRCDRRNNPPDGVDRGELLAEVGVAPAVPAEFVVLRIGRAGDTLEIREV